MCVISTLHCHSDISISRGTQYRECQWTSKSSPSKFLLYFSHVSLLRRGMNWVPWVSIKRGLLWVRKGNETKLLLKLSAPDEFVINLYIGNFTLLLNPSLRGLNLSRTLQSPPWHQIPPRPLFLMCRKKPSVYPIVTYIPSGGPRGPMTLLSWLLTVGACFLELGEG